MLAGLAGVALIMAWRAASEDTLYIPRIDRVAAPILDGDVPDAAWRLAPPRPRLPRLGGHLAGKGHPAAPNRGVHDARWGYLRFPGDGSPASPQPPPPVKR